jgi:hypothetical protein
MRVDGTALDHIQFVASRRAALTDARARAPQQLRRSGLTDH